MESNTINCRNCGEGVTGKFCSNCGQPVKVKRVDGHYIWHEIQHILHLEKGFLYTIKELLIRPGQNVREFIADNRDRLVKPVIFIIVTSLIYSTIVHFFHIEDQYVNYSDDKATTTAAIFAWIENHYGYANILMGVFIALWLKVFFKRYPYNFFEILILLCFVMGMGMLIAAIFQLAGTLLKLKLMQVAGGLLIIYLSWAIGQFFDKRKLMNYVKSFIAYLLGMITFTLIAMLIGFIADNLFKH
jgi:ribosomal protein L37E